MKTIVNISLLFVLFFGINLYAQEDDPDKFPQPIGGIEEMIKNVVYPITAKEAGIEGKVLVKDLIDENGNVAETEVIESVNTDYDKAAVDAIKNLSLLLP